jgi:hypothetical protein
MERVGFFVVLQWHWFVIYFFHSCFLPELIWKGLGHWQIRDKMQVF